MKTFIYLFIFYFSKQQIKTLWSEGGELVCIRNIYRYIFFPISLLTYFFVSKFFYIEYEELITYIGHGHRIVNYFLVKRWKFSLKFLNPSSFRVKVHSLKIIILDKK